MHFAVADHKSFSISVSLRVVSSCYDLVLCLSVLLCVCVCGRLAMSTLRSGPAGSALDGGLGWPLRFACAIEDEEGKRIAQCKLQFAGEGEAMSAGSLSPFSSGIENCNLL